MKDQKVTKIEDAKEMEEVHDERGAFWSSIIFVGGFIFALYVVYYLLYMIRVGI
ncbi:MULTISPECIES: hypothetical protein [Allobacillus]|uniref:Cytochrome c oxidase subunit 2A n=1 Tax=Allobacillus halotolerans TaxID=570278 RepID=A0ABS6GUQ3_9BACI|nr:MULTISPECIES: hypothetical protein [Allobacillus]MBU6081907.1 hypothetical protein [Allobacillus halotolerans]